MKKGAATRIYFGAEFCERLIPSIGECREVISRARDKGMDFSLVTPYVTDTGISRLRYLFDLMACMDAPVEVIVNDWGVLGRLRNEYTGLAPVLGRLLTKQKRGPRIKRLLERRLPSKIIRPKEPSRQGAVIIVAEKLPPDADLYYRGSNASSVPIIHGLLKENNVRRIEIDNLLQGIYLDMGNSGISVSAYTPYAYISTTMFCQTIGCERKHKPFLRVRPCAKECRRYTFRLRHKSMPEDIILKGNTQFYKNGLGSIRKLEQAGIDRIVYQQL